MHRQVSLFPCMTRFTVKVAVLGAKKRVQWSHPSPRGPTEPWSRDNMEGVTSTRGAARGAARSSTNDENFGGARDKTRNTASERERERGTVGHDSLWLSDGREKEGESGYIVRCSSSGGRARESNLLPVVTGPTVRGKEEGRS